MDPTWRQVNLVCALTPGGDVVLTRKPVPALRPELLGLFELSELKKYMTDEELATYQPAKDGE